MTAVNSFVITGWPKKAAIFGLFFILETLVFAMLPLAEVFPIHSLLYVHGGITACLLVAALLLRRSPKGRQYWQGIFALFVAGLAVLLSTLYEGDLLGWLGLTTATPQGVAVVKFSEMLWRSIPLVVLMLLSGADLRSLYLNRGRIGLGLAVGGAGFLLFAGLAFIPLLNQAGMGAKLVSMAPWILIFIMANAFEEELLYRGLLLKRYEALLGKPLANLLTTVVFTLVHLQVNYVADVPGFLLKLFPLALVWGYLTQKTDSLWGSVLFHAGADCLIILAIFASV